MDVTSVAKLAVDLGLVPILLLVFIKHFMDKDKARDKQICNLAERFEKREEIIRSEIERREGQYREREDMLIAEGTRREELMRKESEKREKLMREEADKRENVLMETIKGFIRTIEKISDAMSEMKNAFVQIECKIVNIEGNIERMGRKNGQAG
jgi:hypothetical protein